MQERNAQKFAKMITEEKKSRNKVMKIKIQLQNNRVGTQTEFQNAKVVQKNNIRIEEQQED